MTIFAKPGETIPLSVRMADGNEAVYPRARVVEELAGAVPVATVDLDHVLAGFYRGTWTVPGEGRWVALFDVFTDAGRTALSTTYRREIEAIFGDAGGASVAHLELAYDDTAGILRGKAWLMRSGVLASATSAVVQMFDETGASVFLLNLGAGDIGADGLFGFSQAVALADDQPYSVAVSVTDALGTVSKIVGTPTLA